MRKLVWIVAAVAIAEAATAQEPGEPAEDLLSTQAQVCLFGDEVLFVPIREAADGSLQALGQWQSWQTVKAEDGRITLTAADDFLQMDQANSLVVADGNLRQGVCSDQTLTLRGYVSAVVGGEGPEGVSSFRGSLIEQVVRARQLNEELQAQVQSARNEEAGPLRIALEAARARNGELRRQLDIAEARLRELEEDEP